MTSLVVDASALVTSLTDAGPTGSWVRAYLSGDADLAGPHLLPFEAANVLRRLEVHGSITPEVAAQAHADLVDLRIALWDYETVAAPAWRLRRNTTVYDATYVVVAAALDAPLITLDRRLARTPGLGCRVLLPPD